MSNLVIVALPAEDDYIHKISSEKVPHMTLLFLGEDASKVRNLSNILNFTKHAADRTLNRFGMEVDHRGKLGDTEADVLFFAKSKWSGFETIRDYRSYLLKDDNIRKAYDSTEQFSEWMPHITLGYPDTPAKPDDRDYPGITYVNFDRIAVWFGEYEGIEFPLKAYEWNETVAMSTTEVVDDILAHFGKKGMKWGVRNNRSGSSSGTSKDIRKENLDGLSGSLRIGGTRKAFKDSRKDAKFQRKTVGGFYPKTTNAIIKDATKNMKPEIKALKKKPEYSGMKTKRAIRKGKYDLHSNNPIVAKYNKEASAIYMKHVIASAPKHLKVSPSGKWEHTFTQGQGYWNISLKKVDGAKHSVMSNPDIEFRVRPIFDDEGYIEDFELIPLEDSIEQSAMVVNDILAHFGKKGMKWGVRNARNNSSSVSVVDKKKKIKTYGGKGRSAHPEAVRVRTIGQVAKKSGLKALSNDDLKAFNERLNLEQSAKRLNYNDKSPPKKFVLKILGQQGNQLASDGAKTASAIGVKKVLKVAALAA